MTLYRLVRVDGEFRPSQWRTFMRLRRRDLQRASEMSAEIADVTQGGGRFGRQWDADAHFGWKSKAIERTRETAKKHDMNLYECLVDSCHYSREEEEPCHHAWKILTKSKELYQKLGRRKCPGQKDHSVARNRVAYPQKLAEDIADAIGWEMPIQYPS